VFARDPLNKKWTKGHANKDASSNCVTFHRTEIR